MCTFPELEPALLFPWKFNSDQVVLQLQPLINTVFIDLLQQSKTVVSTCFPRLLCRPKHTSLHTHLSTVLPSNRSTVTPPPSPASPPQLFHVNLKQSRSVGCICLASSEATLNGWDLGVMLYLEWLQSSPPLSQQLFVCNQFMRNHGHVFPPPCTAHTNFMDRAVLRG